LKRAVLAACFGWLFSAIDIVLLFLFQHDIAVGLRIPIDKLGLVIAAGSVGSAVGGIVFAQWGDRYGRVRVLGWCIIVYSFATAGMATAHSLQLLLLMRFLTGVGTGGEWSLGFALVSEVAPRTGRGKLGGMVAAMFNLGTFIAIGLFQAKLSWRVAFGVMALPSLGVLILRMTVPESPMWLALQEARKKGEVEPALEAAYKRPPLALLFRDRLLGPTLKITLIFTLMNFAFFGFSTTFMRYIQEPVSSGALGLGRAGQIPFNLASNGASLVSAFLAGWLSDRIGPAGLPLIFGAIVTGYGVNGVIGTITSEIFPTHLRATGPGFTQNLGKGIGGALGPILVGSLILRTSYPIALALPGIILVVLAGLIWTLPHVGGREMKAVEDESYLETKPA